MNSSALVGFILALFTACAPVGPEETEADPFLSPSAASDADPCSALIGPSWIARFDYPRRQIECQPGDACVIVRLRLFVDGSFRREVSTSTDNFAHASVERSRGSYTLDGKVLMLLGCDGTVVEYSVDEVSDQAWTGSGFQFHPAIGTDPEQLSDDAFASLRQCP